MSPAALSLLLLYGGQATCIIVTVSCVKLFGHYGIALDLDTVLVGIGICLGGGGGALEHAVLRRLLLYVGIFDRNGPDMVTRACVPYCLRYSRYV